MTEFWEKEEIFFDAQSFFSHLEKKIDEATRAVDLETYIFDNDALGTRVADKLIAAAKRGLHVRVMVDGFGSPNWARQFLPQLLRSGVDARIYHPMPMSALSPYFERYPSLAKFFNRLATMNERNHRKTCIIDREKAWVGGMNVSASHAGWRDTGVYIEGPRVQGLSYAFALAWRKAWSPLREPQRRTGWRKFRRWISMSLIRLNTSYKSRKDGYRDLVKRISSATQRLWITNAYFVPPQRLLRALKAAAARGVDVKILVPHKTDVFFMTWVSSAFYCGLIKSGVKIFEYLPSQLHAKTLLIDGWATIGTTNLNHRSFIHDLEVDIVVAQPESLRALESKFVDDLDHSREVAVESWNLRPLKERVLGRILLYLRYWI